MNAVLIEADRQALQARRDRALASVQLTADELRARIDADTALADEREAWEEVDTVNFLLAGFTE
jgi:hypothetical protein